MKFEQRLPAIMGAVAVAMGAFGGHGLKSIIEIHGRLSTWDTAMQYCWVHTLAMLIVACCIHPSHARSTILWLWFASTLLFSGSLMALALGAPGPIGAITPVGGIGFIAGWLLLAFNQVKKT